LKLLLYISFCLTTGSICSPLRAQTVGPQLLRYSFGADTIELRVALSFNISFPEEMSISAIEDFYLKAEQSDYSEVINTLLAFKNKNKLNDWLYYQLIRKTAQQLSPKTENYYRYTLYKWFLLCKSGYDALIRTGGNKMLFYVRSDENIYNIPFHLSEGKQYICLNYHDYGGIDFETIHFKTVMLYVKEARGMFSYRVTQLPDFNPADYIEKDLQFTYKNNNYQFRVKLNPHIKNMFTNYPVMDYENYFNIPLSRETYISLIPLLKKQVEGKPVKKGIDFLMRFTRNAFVFEEDSKVFGNEKRFSPEQTLLYDQSDCEDRTALLYFLVKEIYNLPVIVLAYEKHVTLAIHLSYRIGKPVKHNGTRYYVCEPTPQKYDLKIGEMIPSLRKAPFEIVYEYQPVVN
jgi:hypothetical protein